jgi:hypothetical protein
MLRALPVLFGLLAAPAAAQPLPPPVIPLPVLAAELSVRRIEVTTAFTGGEILVFGATERLIHEGGDEVVVLASGPDGSLVVRGRSRCSASGSTGPPPASTASRPTGRWRRPPGGDDAAARRTRRAPAGLDLLLLPQLGAQGGESARRCAS